VERRAAPQGCEAVDRRELVGEPGGQQQPTGLHTLPAVESQPEAFVGEGVGAVHGALAELHTVISGELFAPDPPQLLWWGAVVGEQVVDRGRRGVAALAGVQEQHTAAAAAEGEGGGQPGRAAANDDRVTHGFLLWTEAGEGAGPRIGPPDRPVTVTSIHDYDNHSRMLREQSTVSW
jgi:hypothetical protein